MTKFLDKVDFINKFKEINDVIENIKLSYDYLETLHDWKGVVDILQREKKKIKTTCEYPTRLTADDKLQIEKIVKTCKDIILNNKIFIMVYKDLIIEQIDQLMLNYNKRLLHEISHPQDIRHWIANPPPTPDDRTTKMKIVKSDDRAQKKENITFTITELERINNEGDDIIRQILE
jgi:hypothetical protein